LKAKFISIEKKFSIYNYNLSNTILSNIDAVYVSKDEKKFFT
jgi:hypothetical protein